MLGLWQYFRQCSEDDLNRILIRYHIVCKAARSSPTTEGCRITHASMMISWICPSEECVSLMQKVARRWGSHKSRPQNLYEAVVFSKKQDWLGVIRTLFGRDKTGSRLHRSHFCRAINGVCWTPSHATQEEKFINTSSRHRHQSGSELCDCADHGGDPCLTNGANIPVLDSDEKIVMWLPNQTTYPDEASMRRTSVSTTPRSTTLSTSSSTATSEQDITTFSSLQPDEPRQSSLGQTERGVRLWRINPQPPQVTSSYLFTKFSINSSPSQHETGLNLPHSSAQPETADSENWEESRITLEEATQELEKTGEEQERGEKRMGEEHSGGAEMAPPAKRPKGQKRKKIRRAEDFSCQLGDCKDNDHIYSTRNYFITHLKRYHKGASKEDAIAASRAFLGQS